MSTDDPKATTVLFVGIVSVAAVFLIVVMLQVVFYRMQEREVARKSLDHAPEELAQLRASQQAELHSYGWIDEAGGVAQIPIERAMARYWPRALPWVWAAWKMARCCWNNRSTMSK